MRNASVQRCHGRIGKTIAMNPTGLRGADTLYVLLVEADDVDAKLIDVYAASMRVPQVVIERAVSATEAQRLLAEWSFDLCIFDFRLGCESSLRLLAGLHIVPPAIVLTSLSTPDIHRMCQWAAATSFIGKEGLSPALLESAILGALRSRTPSQPPPENGEDAMVELVTSLLDSSPPDPSGDTKTPLSGDRLHARSAMRCQLGPLLEMTETVRFGLFEKVRADQRRPTLSFRGGQHEPRDSHAAQFHHGFAELLATSQRLEPDLQRYADLARSSGSARLSVVNDILDFSKAEAGAMELAKTTFDPVALLNNCLSIARGLAMARPLRIDLRYDSEVPRALVGDEGRLRQILLNLLDNAVKFTSEGLVTLTLRHEGSDERGEKLWFSVTDTGIGIAKEKQDRLFERVCQIDGTVRRDFGGTGLGLAFCKRLVELMDGEIGVFSDDGEGSTFWFIVTLPTTTARISMATKVPAVDVYRRGRLLLIDDVEVNRELARVVLEIVGHSVDVVADGPAAISALRSGVYDLVLMDIQMPGMDGMTATRKIRQFEPPLNRIPIIAMTANVFPDQIRQIRESGMDDHVGKPFDRKELYSTIERWLPVSGRGSEAASDNDVPPSFDRTVYQDLSQLLGRDNVARLARKLLEELSLRFEGDDLRLSLDRIRQDVHATIPAAGMLGFTALSAACLALHDENGEPHTEAFANRLAAVRARRDEAIVILGRLGESGASPTSHPMKFVH